MCIAIRFPSAIGPRGEDFARLGSYRLLRSARVSTICEMPDDEALSLASLCSILGVVVICASIHSLSAGGLSRRGALPERLLRPSDRGTPHGAAWGRDSESGTTGIALAMPNDVVFPRHSADNGMHPRTSEIPESRGPGCGGVNGMDKDSELVHLNTSRFASAFTSP